jgi:hypothetical protein
LILVARKIWVFLKHNWWIPLGLVGIVLFAILQMTSARDAILRAMTRAQELHRSDLDAISAAYAAREAARRAADEEYKKKEAAIAAEHQAALKAIEDEKKRREEELAKLDQDELTNKLGEVAGLDVVKLPDGK